MLEKHALTALSKYGNWLEAITTAKFKPETQAQKRFLDAHEGKNVPTTEPEKTWKTYRNTVIWQKNIDAMDGAALQEYRKSYMYLDKKSKYMSEKLI